MTILINGSFRKQQQKKHTICLILRQRGKIGNGLEWSKKKPKLQSKSNDWQVNASGRTNKIMRTDRVRLVDGIGLGGAEIIAKKNLWNLPKI